MPSHKIHEKYALRYGISLDLVKAVNKAIDFGIHDAGRKPEDAPFAYGLARVRRFDRFSALLVKLERHFGVSILAKVLEAAIVHILLDELVWLISHVIKQYSCRIVNVMKTNEGASRLLHIAASILKEKDLDDRQYALSFHPEFRTVFEVIDIIRDGLESVTEELINDLIKKLLEKNQISEYEHGEAEIRELLKSIVRRGIIYKHAASPIISCC